MEKKMAIITDMVNNGYYLMGHTKEWYCENFSEETLEDFRKNFFNYKEINR